MVRVCQNRIQRSPRTQPDGLSKAEKLFFIDKPLNGFSTTIHELITNSFHSFSQIFTNSSKPTQSASIFFFFRVSHTERGGFPRDVACRGELPTTDDSAKQFHHLHSLPILMVEQGAWLILLLAFDLLFVLTHFWAINYWLTTDWLE